MKTALSFILAICPYDHSGSDRDHCLPTMFMLVVPHTPQSGMS
jgi:hypothetical protein